MRCASCGTENAPDSRFCGECGARTAPSTVAPTQKISDDAPMPVPSQDAYTAANNQYSIPPANQGPPAMPPPSIPPTNNIAPYSGSQIGRAQTAPSAASIPPTNHPYVAPPGTGSIPPTNVAPGTMQRRASTPTPPPAASPTPSVSLPKKPQGGGTRWGIVLFVLVIDLGLAAAGAWMLRAGLAT
ncbi:MAG: zinc ribbon domain-containing protein [Deltaproteobacteria bacterium]|nr:zinc ribbon domain-containing protein [Deltaproteobacteria bacterium]